MKIITLILTVFFLWTANQSVNNLADTNWSLLKVSKGTVIQLADTSCGTTLRFDSNGHYSGNSGCNLYSGNYSTTADKLLTMNNPGRTKRGCHPPCDLGETLFGHFPKTKNYLLQADTLVLWTVDSVTIVFNKK